MGFFACEVSTKLLSPSSEKDTLIYILAEAAKLHKVILCDLQALTMFKFESKSRSSLFHCAPAITRTTSSNFLALICCAIFTSFLSLEFHSKNVIFQYVS